MEKEIRTTINCNDGSSGHWDVFSQQYRINKQLPCAVGLWPYQSHKDKSVHIVGLLIQCFIIMAAQVQAMMGALDRFDLFVECFTPLATNVIGFLKLSSGLFHTQEMRNIFDQIQKDWEAMQHLPHVHILERCAEKGRHWTIFYFIFVYSIVFGWYIMALFPKVMDAVTPLNYSRKRFDMFPADFGVDPNFYFYPIIIFLCWGVLYITVYNVPPLYRTIKTITVLIRFSNTYFFKIYTSTKNPSNMANPLSTARPRCISEH